MTIHPPPREPYLDESRGVWVLSRYRDVLAALREPRLWPAGSPGEDPRITRDEAGRLRLRGPTMDNLPAARVAEWQQQLEPVARGLLQRLAGEQTVDLLTAFAMPLCLRFALLVLDPPTHLHERLAGLGGDVFAATGAPDDSPLRAHASSATAELETFLRGSVMPMPEPTFVALSQTTPRLLASIWIALFEHPAEIVRVRRCPDLWPLAVEELLRYAGIVRRIWRQAKSHVEIGPVVIPEGQRVMLMLGSANRDPEQFADPDRLDLGRRASSQFALGAGRNSCAGASLVRTAVLLATEELIEHLPDAALCAQPQWRSGSGYCFPESVPVCLRRTAPTAVFT